MKNRMLNWIRTLFCAAAFMAPAVALTACETEEGPLEEAAEDVDQAAEDAGEGIEDATDGID